VLLALAELQVQEVMEQHLIRVVMQPVVVVVVLVEQEVQHQIMQQEMVGSESQIQSQDHPYFMVVVVALLIILDVEYLQLF
jgi:hypothetical protein